MSQSLRKKKTEPVSSRLDALKPPHNEWVPRVKFNIEKGNVNRELLVVLSEMTHWKVESDRKFWFEITKRLFDIVFSLTVLILCFPLLLICIVAIRIDSRGSVFYKQLRAGRFGHPFWIWKFRTMSADSSSQLYYLKPMEKPDGYNLTTRVGKFLRNHKIDEFPQIWNVLKGEMSVVGPRPFSMSDSASILTNEYARFAVRPGLTGLWQATIPNNIDGKVKLRLDRKYIKRRSWRLDLFLLVRTVVVIIRGENAFSKRFKKSWFQSSLEVASLKDRKKF